MVWSSNVCYKTWHWLLESNYSWHNDTLAAGPILCWKRSIFVWSLYLITSHFNHHRWRENPPEAGWIFRRGDFDYSEEQRAENIHESTARYVVCVYPKWNKWFFLQNSLSYLLLNEFNLIHPPQFGPKNPRWSHPSSNVSQVIYWPLMIFTGNGPVLVSIPVNI